MAALVVLLLLVASASPSAAASSLAPPCGAEPRADGPLEVEPNASLGLWAWFTGNGRMSTWTFANGTYTLYLLDGKQYAQFDATGSGFNGTPHAGPPRAWVWTSGATGSTNDSFALSGGSWYLLAYDRARAPVDLYVAELACGPS